MYLCGLKTDNLLKSSFSDLIHDYTLLSIETRLEDYRLAYFLNKTLGILLERDKEDLLILYKDFEGEYSKYTYIDDVYKSTWHLISNVFVYSESFNLFDDLETKHHLIPEKKKSNFFLKIEEFYEEDDGSIINKISSIPNILKVELIDPNGLKSRDNLMF